MSLYRDKRVYTCPIDGLEVKITDNTCPNGHVLDWGTMPAKPAVAAHQLAAGTKEAPVKPDQKTDSKFSGGVLVLYIIIISVLGAALFADLDLGKDPSAIITAITTIAGFAVGINTNQKSSTS
jgi:hypothetical protein